MNKLNRTESLKNKKVLLRTDFDVPVSGDGTVEEVFRIEKQKPMLDYLVNQGAVTIMVAHITDEDVRSFSDLIPQLEKLLGHGIKYFDSLESLELNGLQPGFIGLLNKIRDYDGEIKNDKEFARKLAKGFDIYINNAFAVSHRKHASVSAVTEFLPSYAGFLLEEETKSLSNVLNSPKENKLIIMGGAKAETKIPVIKNFIDKADKIILGGVIANDVLKERGVDIDDSTVDKNSKELLVGLDINDNKLVLPEDFNTTEGKILDIGPKTIENFISLIKEAKMVVWNGPVGLFENPDYAKGTNALAITLAGLKILRVIGGGDTVAAVNKLGLLDKFDFVSTGGGAMLEFLAGDKLPGLEALGYYE